MWGKQKGAEIVLDLARNSAWGVGVGGGKKQSFAFWSWRLHILHIQLSDPELLHIQGVNTHLLSKCVQGRNVLLLICYWCIHWMCLQAYLPGNPVILWVLLIGRDRDEEQSWGSHYLCLNFIHCIQVAVHINRLINFYFQFIIFDDFFLQSFQEW